MLDLAEVAGDILAVATELEGHADNVAASLHGGVVATAGGRAVRVPLAVEPAVVVWVPSFTTSTDQSRTALGDTVAFDDAVFNVGRTALLVAALAAGDVDVAAHRHRGPPAPGRPLRPVAAVARGAGGGPATPGRGAAGCPGSGPSVAALCDPADAERIAAAYPEGASVKVLAVDQAGAIVV